jgi:hypothetical protein
MFDFAIIGAQKAGTTALAAMLRTNPSVDLMRGEFAGFDGGATPGDLKRLPQFGRRFGFKRADLLADLAGMKALLRTSPDVSLLVTIRNPTDRAIAAYLHYVRDGFAPLMPVDICFRMLLAQGSIPGHPRTTEILEYGLYGKHLQNILLQQSSRRVTIVEQDQLRPDPDSIQRKLADLLDIECRFRATRRRPMPTIRSYNRLYLRSQISRLIYSYDVDRTRLKARSRLAASTVARIDELLGPGTPDCRLVPEEKTRSELDMFYQQDQALLQELVAEGHLLTMGS